MIGVKNSAAQMQITAAIAIAGSNNANNNKASTIGGQSSFIAFDESRTRRRRLWLEAQLSQK
jgi:hypothetical protein